MSEASKIMGEAIAATRSASKQLTDGITSIREHIGKLKQQKSEIASKPVTIEAALARAEGWVHHITRGAVELSPSAQHFARPDYHLSGRNANDLLIAQMAARMSDTLKADIEKLYAERPGITEEERVMHIREIERKILDAELTEESMIRAAEAGGFPVLRRRNADPRAVLAHDKVLP
jgi:hypothetical protein